MPRGGMAARGPPVGVLRSAAHRRAESRFWGVFIIAVHRAFVLGLGARHRGIVELSEGVIRCVTVFACYSSSSSSIYTCRVRAAGGDESPADGWQQAQASTYLLNPLASEFC